MKSSEILFKLVIFDSVFVSISDSKYNIFTKKQKNEKKKTSLWEDKYMKRKEKRKLLVPYENRAHEFLLL